MLIDTSALVAILFGESDAATLATEIERDPTRLISAASMLEAAMVVESKLGGDGDPGRLDFYSGRNQQSGCIACGAHPPGRTIERRCGTSLDSLRFFVDGGGRI